jgi:hypothetical protein
LIRTSELANMDVIKLLKHGARFPDTTLIVHSLPDVSAGMRASLQALISNKTERWVQALRHNKISQVRLQLNGNHNGPAIRVVVKECYALPWMKSSLTHRLAVADSYAKGLGLGDVEKVWDFIFAVDYS